MPPAYESLKLERRAKLFLAGACLMIFSTATEIRYPVISLGFVNFTNSELAAGLFFITAAVWALTDSQDFFQRRTLDLGVGLFLASNYLSVLTALDQASALKFSLRMTFAALVYVGVSRLPARKNSHLVVAGAATVTLLIVTIVGLLESFSWPVDWAQLLTPWHEGVITFGSFLNLRISSTLPYPTTLSMYLELMLPLSLAFALWLTHRQSGSANRFLFYAAIMVGVIAVIIIQLNTYTRSALVATPVSLLGAAALAVWSGYSRRIAFYFAIAGVLLVIVMGIFAVFSNKLASRIGVSEQMEHYSAEYTLLDIPSDMKPGKEYAAKVRIKNTSDIYWRLEGKEKVFGDYFWLAYPEKRVLEDVPNIISDLPAEVRPGQSVEMKIGFNTPGKPGRYVLLLELIKTHVGPFADADVPPLVVPLEFDENGSRPFKLSDGENFVKTTSLLSSPARGQLWRAALKAWKSSPVLGIGPDQFRRHYSEFAPELRQDERVGAHNIFLEALSNTGVLGLLAMIFLLGSAAVAGVRLVRGGMKAGTGMGLTALALVACLIAYVMHGMLDYFLWQTGVAFLFFAELGLISWIFHVWKDAKAGGDIA